MFYKLSKLSKTNPYLLSGCRGLRIKIELSVRYLFYVFVVVIIVVIGFPVYWTESLTISHNSNDYKQYKHGQQQ